MCVPPSCPHMSGQVLEHTANTPSPNPAVVAPTTVLTNPNFDPIALRLALGHLTAALGELGGRSQARTVNLLDPGCSLLSVSRMRCSVRLWAQGTTGVGASPSGRVVGPTT